LLVGSVTLIRFTTYLLVPEHVLLRWLFDGERHHWRQRSTAFCVPRLSFAAPMSDELAIVVAFDGDSRELEWFCCFDFGRACNYGCFSMAKGIIATARLLLVASSYVSTLLPQFRSRELAIAFHRPVHHCDSSAAFALLDCCFDFAPSLSLAGWWYVD
jgi:hypothetical protein